MPVVINEFEAVADTAPPVAPPAEGGAPGAKPKARDLRRPIAVLARRRARVWAH
ncbi:hypothetical protein [Novosphingobium sp. AP12]|uniref:hypothetical protein n=1 Tax=Novosphingobium sp. AP12 TaxID=1144305 RepID=UPI000271E7CE|nr:hypothetical protein [Novosphingobium sp. AP12]EJL23188.1 hypothetical protein PMI02_04269 [Novosphingobium sp. AP12]